MRVKKFINRLDEKINICKKQQEMKKDITTIKNTMDGFHSKL